MRMLINLSGAMFFSFFAMAGHYAKDVYPEVRAKYPDLIKTSNDYMLSLEESEIAKNELGPQVNLDLEGIYTGGKEERVASYFNNQLGLYLTFDMPIYDVQRSYALVKSFQNQSIKDLQKSVSEQQFLMVFSEGLLRISQAKTRYYFAKQNLEYFNLYFEKEKAREQREFSAQHPGVEFNWKKSLLLLTLDQDLRSLERTVESLHTTYVNEKTAFEVGILDEKLGAFIMVNPFVERKDYPISEDRLVQNVLSSNFSLKLSDQGILLADLKVDEASKLRRPRVSLFASSGVIAESGSSSSQRNRDDMVGIRFSFPLAGHSIKNKQKIAQLEKENAFQERVEVMRGIEEEARVLHQRINLSVKNIASLIESYHSSKYMIDTFLDQSDLPDQNALQNPGDQFVVPASNADRKRIMDTHFTITRDLALEQHSYLIGLLRLHFLLGDLNPRSLGKMEDAYFVSCDNYDGFIKLGLRD